MTKQDGRHKVTKQDGRHKTVDKQNSLICKYKPSDVLKYIITPLTTVRPGKMPSCFASVDLEKEDEYSLFFQIDHGKTASAA